MPSSQVMKKFKAHKLKSGSKDGPTVTKPAQAKAIAASEAREEREHGSTDNKKKRTARAQRLEGKSI